MFENSIHLSLSEREILEEAIKLGQKASNYDQNNKEIEALVYYNKSILVLEKEIKKMTYEKQILLQTLLDTYKERVKILENINNKKNNNSFEESMTSDRKYNNEEMNYNITNSNNLSASQSWFNKFGKNILMKERNDHLKEINIFTNLCLKSNEQNEILENSLNIIDQREKILFLLRIIEKTLLTGGRLTKNIYIPSIIWKIQIVESEESQIKKMQSLKKINEEILSVLTSTDDFFNKCSVMRSYFGSIYKDDKFQKILNMENVLKKKKFDLYQDLIKKNFAKINMYINPDSSNKTAFVETSKELIANMIKLLGKKEFETNYKGEEEWNINKRFIFCFFKDVVLRLLINELEMKLCQFIILAKKKIND